MYTSCRLQSDLRHVEITDDYKIRQIPRNCREYYATELNCSRLN